MRISVTGAKGQLGNDLIRLLDGRGHKLFCHDMDTLDITDEKSAVAAIERDAPGLIINLAAYTAVDRAEGERDKAYDVNVRGAANMASAAKKTGAWLIHISTDFVFDGKKSTPYTEDDEARPLSVYGLTKLEGEKEIIKRHDRHMIIRTAWLYGSHGQNFVKTILRLAGERCSLNVICDQIGTPTWTMELAKAIEAIIDRPGGSGFVPGIYHFTNEGVASWYDFAVAIIEEANALGVALKCERIEPVATSEYPTSAVRPHYSVLDKTKIKKEFGITIPHWRTSLRMMLKEFYSIYSFS
ncbi:MAG: dTDP-4-dehydrorhamnose reductase [Deltaproteobacteria bacterium]|nr:dTDP-4-dehydrorhamnose reductase [Deltaproteobacteria bacterium]